MAIPNTLKQQVAELSGVPVRPYSTVDFGREKRPNNISVVVSKQQAYHLLGRLRDTLPQGFVGFIGTTNWLGEERHDGVELVVGSGESQFDMVRLAESNAANYGLDTEDLIPRLQQYDHDFGINIIQAETDTIEFDMVGYPTDMMALAKDIYQFCPDAVDQGAGSIEALAEGIEVMGRVVLWWD